MRSRRRKLGLWGLVGLVLVLGFAGGYAVGTLRMFRWMVTQLSSETQGNLNGRVETLARLRTGDEAGAIAKLEQAVDIAIETLPQERSWNELPSGVQRSLMLGKAYRSAYPPADPSLELSRILAEVPLPERQSCSAALQHALSLADTEVIQE